MGRASNTARHAANHGRAAFTLTSVITMATALEKIWAKRDRLAWPADISADEIRSAGGPAIGRQTKHGLDRDFVRAVSARTPHLRVDYFSISRGGHWHVVLFHGGAEYAKALHEDMKAHPDRVRDEWQFSYFTDAGGIPYEGWTCQCGSTLHIRGIGPAEEGAE